MAPTVLPAGFYARSTLDVARDLIGKVLVHHTPAGRTSGVIVEVEAYVGESDPACHAATGFSERNAPLYGPPGRAYVYLSYGVHYLVNAVTEPEGAPAAVLLRALEPRDGLDLMRRRRGRSARGGRYDDADLCRGPGNLSRALGISLAQNRADLGGRSLYIEDGDPAGLSILWGPRIGIRVGTRRPWRCYVENHVCVSGRARRSS